MIDWLALLIFALATWRISSLLVNEPGPFKIFYKIRVRVGLIYSKSGELIGWKDGFLPELLSCVWCCSVYVAALWVELHFFFPVFTLWIALPFALSATAILTNLLVEKLK